MRVASAWHNPGAKWYVVILLYSNTFPVEDEVQKPSYELGGQTLVQLKAFQVLQLAVGCGHLVPLNCAFNVGNGKKMTEQNKINLNLILIVVRYHVSAYTVFLAIQRIFSS